MKNDSKNLEVENIENDAVIRLLRERVMMLESFQDSGTSGNEIDLIRVYKALVKGKWIIAGCSLLLLLSSAVFSFLLPNEYRATAILAPAATSSDSQFSALAGQFGGLASLAGVNLGNLGGDDKTMVAIELMRTWGFIESFVSKNSLEADVFAVKNWNRITNTVIYDEDIYDPTTGTWVREHDPDKLETPHPSSWELYESFNKKLNITQDSQTGLVRVSVEHYSPVLAKYYVDEYVKAVNYHFKNKEREITLERIEYLEKQVQKTNVSEMQNIFYQLIEEQTKTLMLVEVNDEYVFQTVSEAKIAEEEVRPKRLYIIVLGTIFGGLISSLMVIFLYYGRV